eukprot:jgi/Hompol1/1080/HPOL_001376-RA
MGEPVLDNFGLVNEAARETAYQLVIAVNTTYAIASKVYASIPGSTIVYKYIAASYQNDPIRTLLDVCLVALLIWYIVKERYRPGVNDVKLTEKEVEEIIELWKPEPLVPELTDFQAMELAKTPVMTSSPGLRVVLDDNKERLNFASYNFLGILNSSSVKERAVAALRKYGVGSCGPPGFYGTLDVHVDLHNEIARFLGTEASIVYAQGFACISSCIPAFAKRGDIIVVDDAVNFAVQKGVQISRSHVFWFKHNDMQDLERVLRKVQAAYAKKPLSRRFIVVEGLYANIGDICPLPELIALKKQYKYRLIVEESMSLGVLGSRGAGVSDYFGVKVADVDIIVASMSNAMASAGGFCAGSKEICEHQRLSGQAFTYSASLPAMLTVTSLEALAVLEHESIKPKDIKDPRLLDCLAANIAAVQAGLAGIKAEPILTISTVPASPLIHLQLRVNGMSREDEELILQEIVDLALKDGILITRAKYVLKQEHNPPPASIRISVSAGFKLSEAEKCGVVVRNAARKVLKQFRLIK